MRTRDVLRWNLSAVDALHIAALALGSLMLRALESAQVRIEKWIEES